MLGTGVAPGVGTNLWYCAPSVKGLRETDYVCSVLPMNTPTRAKAFQALPRTVVTLKSGQFRCPVCRRGVAKRPNGALYGHNDTDGSPCDSSTVRVGYVYRGKGVDTLPESA